LEKHLVLDRDRYRLVWAQGGPEDPPSPWNRAIAMGMDAVVAQPGAPTVAGLREAFRAVPFLEAERAAPPLALYEPPEAKPLSLDGAITNASEHRGALVRLLSEKTGHEWRTAGVCGTGDWIGLDLPSPVPIERIEITVANGIGVPLRLREGTGEDGGMLSSSEVDFEEHGSLPAEQVLYLDPRPLHALRIGPTGNCSEPWQIRDLRVYGAPTQGAASGH
jgi:hypothetical protein